MGTQSFSLLNSKVQQCVHQMRWEELRPIQVKAIQAILEDEGHLVICAATAGGKTEAAFLPIISRLVTDCMGGIRALYVGPLKALINDQFQRLEKLCDRLGIPVHRWHGDVPASVKKKIRRRPGGILLITPESLESNLINYGNCLSQLYSRLDFVVLDEVHTFLGNVRGKHLQSLLHRISVRAGCQPRMVGLSATLGDPFVAKEFLSRNTPERVSIIEDNQVRPIALKIKAFLGSSVKKGLTPRFPVPREALLSGLTALVSKCASDSFVSFEKSLEETSALLEKAALEEKGGLAQNVHDVLDDIVEDVATHCKNGTHLFFIDSKAVIELFADKLHRFVTNEKWPSDPFLVHHGSISKALRMEAEDILKSGNPVTAVCSSTLELGIDIGSVHSVLQFGPPWSVSSLVQRLGRSGRQEGDVSRMRLYLAEEMPHPGTELEALLFPKVLQSVALVRLLQLRWLEPVGEERLHFSTLIHQVMSCLKQTGGMLPNALFDLLVGSGPFNIVSKTDFISLLRGMKEKDLVEQMPEGDVILSPIGESITSSFDFYPSFCSLPEYSVRDKNSEEIGKIHPKSVPPIGEYLILAGRRWRVENIDQRMMIVFVQKAPGGEVPKWDGLPIGIHTRIFQEMEQILRMDDEPSFLNHEGQLLLRMARNVARNSGILELGFHQVGNEIIWFPWVGTSARLALKLIATHAGVKCAQGKISLKFDLSKLEFLTYLSEVAGNNYNPTELASLMIHKEEEKFDEYLPESLLNYANGKDRLDLPGAKDAALHTLEYNPQLNVSE